MHLGPGIADPGTNKNQRQQRLVAGSAVVFLVQQGLGWQGGHHGGLEDGHSHNEGDVQTHQQQAGDEGTRVHVAHGAAQLVGQHDEHQRGRNGLRQSS